MPEVAQREFQVWLARALADIRQAIDIHPPGRPDPWGWGPLPEPWRSTDAMTPLDLSSLTKSQLELAREKIKLERQWLETLDRHLAQHMDPSLAG